MLHTYSSRPNSGIYWSELLSKLVSIPFVVLLVLLVIAQGVQLYNGLPQTDSVEFYVPSDL